MAVPYTPNRIELVYNNEPALVCKGLVNNKGVPRHAFIYHILGETMIELEVWLVE